MRCLQSVQNAAARLVTGARRCDHITPTLRQLHWLPVRQRVLFKIAVLVFQCLAGQASSYLADDCQLVSDARPRLLRSSDSLTCAVRRTLNTYDDRCFVAAGPRVCNSLRQCDSLRQFRRRLKTYFFRYMGPRCSVTLVRQCCVEILLLTYLINYLLTYLGLEELHWLTTTHSMSSG